MTIAVHHSSVKRDWQTPDDVLDVVRLVGHIALEPHGVTRDQYAYEERAAIIQYGSEGVTRERAEWLAKRQMEQAARRGEQGRLW